MRDMRWMCIKSSWKNVIEYIVDEYDSICTENFKSDLKIAEEVVIKSVIVEKLVEIELEWPNYLKHDERKGSLGNEHKVFV